MLRVRATALASYVSVARALGLDPFALLKRVAIEPSSLEDPENQIAAGAAVNLLEISADGANCSSFGLLMAEARTPESVGALMLLLNHQRTAREMIDSMARYQRLMAEALVISVHDEEGCTSLHLDLVGDLSQRQAIEFAVGSTQRILSAVLGVRWAPEAVHFVHKAPDDRTVHNRVFNCPIIFGSHFNGFSAASSSLTQVGPVDQSALVPYATKFLDTLATATRDASVCERVRRSLYLQLPRGRSSLACVAQDLGVSSRSLQRLIAEEEQSFTDLLNDVRRQLAMRHLRDSSNDVTSVALLTGYSTPSAFNRWFLAEFGETPTAWRCRLTL